MLPVTTSSADMMLSADKLTTSRLLTQMLSDCTLQCVVLSFASSDTGTNFAVDNDSSNSLMTVALPTRYYQAAINYTSWLDYKEKTIFNNQDVELIQQALELANYLEDDSF